MLGQLALNGKHGASNINVLIPQGFGKSLRRVISVCFFTLQIFFFKSTAVSQPEPDQRICGWFKFKARGGAASSDYLAAEIEETHVHTHTHTW